MFGPLLPIDAKTERFTGSNDKANAMLTREYRKGYEIAKSSANGRARSAAQAGPRRLCPMNHRNGFHPSRIACRDSDYRHSHWPCVSHWRPAGSQCSQSHGRPLKPQATRVGGRQLPRTRTISAALPDRLRRPADAHMADAHSPVHRTGRLAQEYNFDEPWDGPNNRLLADHMPKIYSLHGDHKPGGQSRNYLAIVGSKTVWRPGKPVTKDVDRRILEHDSDPRELRHERPLDGATRP